MGEVDYSLEKSNKLIEDSDLFSRWNKLFERENVGSLIVVDCKYLSVCFFEDQKNLDDPGNHYILGVPSSMVYLKKFIALVEQDLLLLYQN